MKLAPRRNVISFPEYHHDCRSWHANVAVAVKAGIHHDAQPVGARQADGRGRAVSLIPGFLHRHRRLFDELQLHHWRRDTGCLLIPGDLVVGTVVGCRALSGKAKIGRLISPAISPFII